MKLIILAAGDSFEIDGFNKLLLKHPKYQLTILELYKKFFDVDKIQIVVGYNAINLINQHPNFDYIYNKKWQTTGSAYSLSLAIDDEPCYVISSDLFLNFKFEEFFKLSDNFIILRKSESKRLSALNAKLNSDSTRVVDFYRGKTNDHDVEIMCFFKITDVAMLKQIKFRSLKSTSCFAGEVLPYENLDVYLAEENEMLEINTVEDYIKLINLSK